MALVLPSHRAPPPPAAVSMTDVPLRVLARQALGTRCEVQYAATSETQAKAFEAAAVGWVAAFEAKYSRFRPDSWLSRINAAAGRAPVAIDAEMEQLLALCDRLHFMTQGVLDPTALPLLRLWDYKAADPVSRPTPRSPTPAGSSAGKKSSAPRATYFCPSPAWRSTSVVLAKSGPSISWRRLRATTVSPLPWLILATISVPSACRPAARLGTSASKIPPIPAPSKARSRSPVAEAFASSGDYLRRVIIDGVRYGHIVDPVPAAPSPTVASKPPIIAPSCLQAGVALDHGLRARRHRRT